MYVFEYLGASVCVSEGAEISEYSRLGQLDTIKWMNEWEYEGHTFTPYANNTGIQQYKINQV